MHRRGRGHGYFGANERSQVSKSFERILKARLEVFASSSENEMKLESLSREERKIVHGIAQKLGLQSRSSGKEPNRVLVISRPMANTTRMVSNICESDAIQLDQEQHRILTDFLRSHPVTPQDIDLHLSRHRKQHHRPHVAGISGQGEMMVPPPPRHSPEVEKFRRNLPTCAHRDEILANIRNHKVTLVTGGTGCGKTTQVPQFLLEDATSHGNKLRIIVTQPRRLPAIAVAERVAKERGERLGSTVGYHIRLEQKVSRDTILTYCTSGVLLRMLTMDANASDISHIILDEIHEREQNTDYLLIALKQALKNRKDLKVILMSATMEGNIDMFLKYFEGVKVGHVDVPSRLFDVDKFYLADVLALTAYTPPDSGFGGMFTDLFPGFGNNKRFPRVDHFEESTMTTVRTEPNLMDMFNGPSSSSFGMYGFGDNRMKHQQMMQSASTSALNRSNGITQLDKNRPTSFSAEYTKTLRNLRLDETTLIDNYMNNGGQQWSDGIDPDLTVATIRYCMDSSVPGAILVFLPGYEDILTVRDKVLNELTDCRTKPEIFTLHSQMNSADQQRVFEKVPHKRKVILSTNIAEASLTIDDVVFVIDCGKVKEKSYDHHSRISQLNVTWIAKSNAEQRSGRAGRCRSGYCFRLYSREEYDQMLIAQVAEMKRSAIHEVCLHAKMFAPEGIPVKDFLEMAPEPPHQDAVHQSLQFLEVLGALSGVPPSGDSHPGQEHNEPMLTELGRHLAHLPLDPQLARLLLFGIALKCCFPIVSLVASLAHRDPFVLPLGDERNSALTARDDFSHCDFSDHITLVRAYYAYNQCPQSNNRQIAFCRSKFLSPNTMKMIHGITRQLLFELRRLGMIGRDMALDDPELNRYSNCWPMIQAAVVAGCYPGIGLVRPGTKLRKIRTSVINNSATLHPGCVIKRQLGPSRRTEKFSTYITGNGEEPKIEYLAYQELAKIDEGITIRTVTAVPPLCVFLFAGSVKLSLDDVKTFGLDIYQDDASQEGNDDMEDFSRRNVFLSLGDDLIVRGPYNDFRELMRLRAKVMVYFMEVMRDPWRAEKQEDRELLDCLSKLLVRDHKRCGFYDCNDLPEPKQLRTREMPPPPPTVIPKINYADDEDANDVVSGDVGFRTSSSSYNNRQYNSESSRNGFYNHSYNRVESHHPAAARTRPSDKKEPESDFDKAFERQIDEWGPSVSVPAIQATSSRRGRPKKYNDYGANQKRTVHTAPPPPQRHQDQFPTQGRTESHHPSASDSGFEKSRTGGEVEEQPVLLAEDWGRGGNWSGSSSSRNGRGRVYNHSYDNNNSGRRHCETVADRFCQDRAPVEQSNGWFGGPKQQAPPAEPSSRAANNGCAVNPSGNDNSSDNHAGVAPQQLSTGRGSSRYQRKKSTRGGHNRPHYGNNNERQQNEYSYSGGSNRFGNSYGQQYPDR